MSDDHWVVLDETTLSIEERKRLGNECLGIKSDGLVPETATISQEGSYI